MIAWRSLIVVFLWLGCQGKGKIEPAFAVVAPSAKDSVELLVTLKDTGAEKRMRAMGLVDVRELEPSIRVDLMYASPDNFVGKILYKDIRKAFMLPEAALRLAIAQKHLMALRPGLRLLICDAARPMQIQQLMWDQVKGTDKREYVSNPANGGGLHNYGAAVDVTLVDVQGKELPMGSPVDFFGDEARPDREEEMVKQGRIMPEHLENRCILRQVMTEAGFRVLSGEWWHFNLMSRQEARKTLRVIE